MNDTPQINNLNSEVELFSHLYVTLQQPIELKSPRKRIIVIAGPTGVGKTSLSIEVAKAIGGEIVSADSMQIYKGMDIGTAKATSEQRDEIIHHLIDICDISTNFNVVDFYNIAHAQCRDILLRDKVPVIVGGSGFYIHSFLYGPPQGPPSIKEVREKLEKKLEEIGAASMYEKLQMLDPKYAKTITENDKHKIVRALEIITITKKTVSDFPAPNYVDESEYDYRCWFLTMPREALYSRVEIRCDEMIDMGFVDEVKKLKSKGLEQNYSASQAIGYRQCLDYLKTEKTEMDFQNFVEKFKQATRHYIKRQITWFKKEPLFRWLDLYETNSLRAIEYILQDYEQGK